MTIAQRLVLILTAVVIAGMLLFPPFIVDKGIGGSYSSLYRFVLNPPATKYVNAPNEPYAIVDAFHLLVQIIGAGLVGGLLYCAGGKEKGD